MEGVSGVDYTDILLSSGYFPPIFGQASTIEQARAVTPDNSAYIAQLQQQYDNALANNTQSALQAALAKDEAKTTPRNSNGSNNSAANNSATNNSATTSTGNTTQAGMNAERALNLLQMAKQAATMRPISQELAVGWGQTARNAELANLYRAIDNARQGQANEAARMSTMMNNPLINGTARV